MKKRILLLLSLLFSISDLYSQLPESPILVEPPPKTSVVSLTPTLKWNAVPGADCYFVFITTDSTSPQTPVCMTGLTTYEVPANQLVPDQVYYWSVTAHNLVGWGAPSSFYSFQTVNTTIEGTIQNLENQVNSISVSGGLSSEQANILINRLEQAAHQLELENGFVSIVQIEIFKFRLIILRASEMLSQDNTLSLNYSADGVIDLIQDLSPQGINPKELKPAEEFALYQNYPNPFNPSTSIEYSIPNNSVVSIKIYDLLGKEVITLVNKYQQEGRYIVTWNASNFSSGIYIYKLSAGGYSETRKMILNK
ncbi:MAG TPA: T9SS type A sorting domain-containing protein [Ignavibacteria bacterium]|jgi:hypothetical protein